MLPLSDYNQADVIEAFHSASCYLDDLHILTVKHFEQMLRQRTPI